MIGLKLLKREDLRMIEITATVESMDQLGKLLVSGVDTVYIGEETFGLRLPKSFSRAQQSEIIHIVHEKGKKVTVAVNALMHPEAMKQLPEYLDFLKEQKVDQITVGDAGVIFVLQRDQYRIPYIYDGETLVTSSRQINFWAKKGAIGSVLAREIPYLELQRMAPELQIFGEILVYGATCIHQSKRPLLQNYFHYVQLNEAATKERGLFISEPKKTDTHYSIYEDNHGTHIFANNDVNLVTKLNDLVALGYKNWKLDGLYCHGDAFVEIAQQFNAAKEWIQQNQWSETIGSQLDHKISEIHPQNRGLDTGFFAFDPEDVK